MITNAMIQIKWGFTITRILFIGQRSTIRSKDGLARFLEGRFLIWREFSFLSISGIGIVYWE
jgi:hypothetical protein